MEKEKQTGKREVMPNQARKGEIQKQIFLSQGWATEKTQAGQKRRPGV